MADKITHKDIEKYVMALPIRKGVKYLLVISRLSGITPKEAAMLHLNDSFLDEIIMVDGLPDNAIKSIPITNK